MADYYAEIALYRDKVASMVAENEEQLVYVVTSAVHDVDWRYALQDGSLSSDVNDDEARSKIIERLRQLADAIENGEIT